MSTRRLTRRDLLRTSAITVTAAGLAGSAVVPRGDSLRIAVVGVGNQGRWNLNQVMHEEVVAICDVDANFLAAAAEAVPAAKTYRDFRRMLEEKETEIDAVLVATPDHTHAFAASMALRMGKHVYCEKPLAHSVQEVRHLRELAAEKGVATQMGTQIHAGSNYRRVVELVRGGAIGDVSEVHVWCGTNWSDGRLQAGTPAPEHLDWDLWQGPTPARDYSPGLHPAGWRRFWDYGTGTLGDMACHYVDLVHWALDLRYPTEISADGPAQHAVGTPRGLKVTWEHPKAGDRAPVRVHWYDAGRRPDDVPMRKQEDGTEVPWGNGQWFIGTEGEIVSDYYRHELRPVEKFADFERPAPTIPDSIGHHREWIRACKEGTPTTCNFDYSGALAEAVLLGNVAYRTGESIRWDGDALKVKGSKAANDLLATEVREGWAL